MSRRESARGHFPRRPPLPRRGPGGRRLLGAPGYLGAPAKTAGCSGAACALLAANRPRLILAPLFSGPRWTKAVRCDDDGYLMSAEAGSGARSQDGSVKVVVDEGFVMAGQRVRRRWRAWIVRDGGFLDGFKIFRILVDAGWKVFDRSFLWKLTEEKSRKL